MSKKSIHLSLNEELELPLKEFARLRGKTVSEIVRYAVELMLKKETIDPYVYNRLKFAIEKRFRIPTGYDVQSFYLTLYMMAQHSPNLKAKKVWGDIVYFEPLDLSCKDVFMEISKEKGI